MERRLSNWGVKPLHTGLIPSVKIAQRILIFYQEESLWQLIEELSHGMNMTRKIEKLRNKFSLQLIWMNVEV